MTKDISSFLRRNFPSFVAVVIFSLSAPTQTSAAPCVDVSYAIAAGNYTSGGYPYIYSSYIFAGNVPGSSPSGEIRNWFVFPIPSFPTPLVKGELRIFAGTLPTSDETETYVLHEVTTPYSNVMNYMGASNNVFGDLGDGPIFGNRAISTNEAARAGYPDRGALIRIPLTAAALSALSAKQGNYIPIGGAVSTIEDTNQTQLVFGSGYNEGSQPHLALYYSSSSPPQITLLTSSMNLLIGDRLILEGLSCGKQPLTRQWLFNGHPVLSANDDVLEIGAVSPSDGGEYRLQCDNDLGTGLSGPIIVKIDPLRIVTQPASITIQENSAGSLFVGVESRYPVTYQWRKNGVILPAQTSSLLQFVPARASDAGSYDVIASNSAGSITSAVATVMIQLRPPFWAYDLPESHIIAVGRLLDLTRYVNGTAPIFYQWYKDGQPFPGATSNSFEVISTTFDYDGLYQLVASNAVGSITSAVMRVTVTPLIISGPNDLYALYRNPASLITYVNSSAPVSLQWFFNDAPLSRGTNAELRFDAIDVSDQGHYFLIGSNRYGMITSQVASVTVITQFPSAYISLNPPSGNVWAGDDVLLYAQVSAGPPATVQWQFKDGDLPGETNLTLRLLNVMTDQSGKYSVVVRNIYGETNAFTYISVVAKAPFFTSIPAEGSSTEVEGSIVTLRVQAVGGPHPTYQWRHNGSDLPGQTNSALVLQNVQLADAGLYEAVARNSVGEATHGYSLQVRRATGLDRWQWRLPKAQGSRLRSVAFGGGRYVAVGKAGNTISSTNGTDWTSAVIEVDVDLNRISYGNGLFVANGWIYNKQVRTNQALLSDGDLGQYYVNDYFGLILVSADGLHWSAGIHPERDIIQSVAGGNGIFVANSTYGRCFCYTSPDAIHWAPRNTNPGSVLQQVTYGDGLFVGADYYRLYYSSNGTDWTISDAPLSSFGIITVAFSGGAFVALDNGGGLLQSSDGIAWTRYEQPYAYLPINNSIAYGAGAYVVPLASPVGHILTTTGGTTWLDVDTQTTQEIQSVIFANGEFLAVGEAGTITRSSDGITWTPNEIANRIDYYGITRSPSLIVAAGDAGTVQTSTDGLTWTQRSTPTTRNLHSIAYGDGLFVAGGRRGAIITSPDGITWTSRSTGVTNYVERIAWANGLWVAVCEGGDIVSSTNGTDWVATSTGEPFTDHEGISYGNGLWVSAGGYFTTRAVSTIFVSTDGRNWIGRGYDVGKRLRDVTYGRGRFVAVGNDGAFIYSSDGANWNSRFVGNQNFRSVHYANGRFVMVGNDGTLMSCSDPANTNSFIIHRSRTSQNLHDIHLAPDGTLVAVGNNGMVLQSGDTRPRFLVIDRIPGGVRLQIDPGIAEGLLRLESSADLRNWAPLADPVTGVMEIPFSTAYRFWRLGSE